MASTVESSHLPVGSPANAPRFAKAVCISLMRSAVGAAWPFTFFLRLDFFMELLADFVEVTFVAVFAEPDEAVLLPSLVPLFLCVEVCAAGAGTIIVPVAIAARTIPA